MNRTEFILRSLKKNFSSYSLYVFALVFSAALYFAFVTLQYDPALDITEGSVKGTAAIRTGSVLLVVIVSIFLLYANRLFIKRRSKEIGLFQLIGMTKSDIFRMIGLESFLLYFSSLLAGIGLGFAVSKLVLLLLFRISGIEGVAALHFSVPALYQTAAVFSGIFLLMLLTNYVFIRRQTILSLFRVVSSTEDRARRLSRLEMGLGPAGLVLIIFGYSLSDRLFDGGFTTINTLFMAMLAILGSVILGTYLFYKTSVSFLTNFLRKRKKGYLTLNEVLSLCSIMFRMKSNSLLLTIITTVSALAIGLLCLSYITYYSAEKIGMQQSPAHFSFTSPESAETFKNTLKAAGIAYEERRIEVMTTEWDLRSILDLNMPRTDGTSETMILSVISDRSVKGPDLAPDELKLSGYNDLMQKFMTFHKSGTAQVKDGTSSIPLRYTGLERNFYIPYTFIGGGLPTAIIDETLFAKLKSSDRKVDLSIGLDILDDAKLDEANRFFQATSFKKGETAESRLEIVLSQRNQTGLILFIVGFLGLAFLVTSGCILYFKQMEESESEAPSYTILRKLGYTSGDMTKGIAIKQLYQFGIPLAVGLLHSYFAVQSGWFLFGAEMWTPMLVVMALYTALYSVFGFLSLRYYGKVIRQAL
ncbi:ABC transporter permease [Paenibacillus aurantius]|uniref:ABC transporter permease n=1 Tax=Paenibacillus aurantius TaxID=2918900 RepID=A0AA96LAE3_9BACL|nr:ABC transporter permease [Paenibacillus aurantius]WNQ10119.1 ABC transporter permease [Paenibacillus aurantius]